jgi:hypothetical protein
MPLSIFLAIVNVTAAVKFMAVSPTSIRGCLQVFATCLLDLFGSNVILDLLNDGPETGCKKIMGTICHHYTSSFAKAQACMKAFEASVLEPAAEAAALVDRMCRCFAYMLSVELDIEHGVERANHKDVLYFTQYSGKAHFQRLFRDLLREDAWKAPVAEVIRCAGSSELLQPQKTELLQILKGNDHLNSDQLARSLVLYGNLQAGMREIEIAEASKLLTNELTYHAKGFLKSKDLQGLDIGMVDPVLAGLEKFGQVPGVLSLAKDLQSWTASHDCRLAAHQLAALMQQGRSVLADEINTDITQLQTLIGKSAKIGAESILQPHIDGFLCNLVGILVDKASCINNGDSG